MYGGASEKQIVSAGAAVIFFAWKEGGSDPLPFPARFRRRKVQAAGENRSGGKAPGGFAPLT